jgi:hypothetical protein
MLVRMYHSRHVHQMRAAKKAHAGDDGVVLEKVKRTLPSVCTSANGLHEHFTWHSLEQPSTRPSADTARGGMGQPLLDTRTSAGVKVSQPGDIRNGT